MINNSSELCLKLPGPCKEARMEMSLPSSPRASRPRWCLSSRRTLGRISSSPMRPASLTTEASSPVTRCGWFGEFASMLTNRTHAATNLYKPKPLRLAQPVQASKPTTAVRGDITEEAAVLLKEADAAAKAASGATSVKVVGSAIRFLRPPERYGSHNS